MTLCIVTGRKEGIDKVRHIVLYSGGLGSFFAAQRVVEKHGAENTQLLFTDTLLEDGDLYRFLIEGACHLYGVDWSSFDYARVPEIEEVQTAQDWEVRLLKIERNKHVAVKFLPNLIWLSDGRDPFKVFDDRKYMGNTRVDPCSEVLKRDISKNFRASLDPNTVTFHIGISWEEKHRYERAKRLWEPHRLDAPLLWEPYFLEPDKNKELTKLGIEIPKLYKLGFSHNNCSGFCVKAGQSHYETLYRTMPARYRWLENRESEVYKQNPNAKPFLRKTLGGKLEYLTLKEFRENHLEKNEQIELGFGGCGCFL